MVLLDVAEHVEVIDHQAMRLGQPLGRDVAEEIQTLEPCAIPEVKTGDRVDRQGREVVAQDLGQGDVEGIAAADGLGIADGLDPAGPVEERPDRLEKKKALALEPERIPLTPRGDSGCSSPRFSRNFQPNQVLRFYYIGKAI